MSEADHRNAALRPRKLIAAIGPWSRRFKGDAVHKEGDKAAAKNQ